MKNLIKLILMLTFVSLNLTFSTVVFAGFFEDFVGDTFADNDTNGVKARAEAEL